LNQGFKGYSLRIHPFHFILTSHHFHGLVPLSTTTLFINQTNMFFRTAIVSLVAAAAGAVAQGVGQGTFYTAGLGSCGIFNTDADAIVAVSAGLFDTFPGAGPNPNLNPICGKPITINFQGKTVQAVVTDKCPGCVGNDLDMTPTLFGQLADLSVGRLSGLDWHFS
jgi:hypothetical protein